MTFSRLLVALLVATLPLISACLVVTWIRSSNRQGEFEQVIQQYDAAPAQTCDGTTRRPVDLKRHSARVAWIGSTRVSLVASLGCLSVFLFFICRGFSTISWKSQAIVPVIYVFFLVLLAWAATRISTERELHKLAHVPVLDYVKMHKATLVTDGNAFSQLIDQSSRAEAIGFLAYWFGVGAIGAGLFRLLTDKAKASDVFPDVHRSIDCVISLVSGYKSNSDNWL